MTETWKCAKRTKTQEKLHTCSAFGHAPLYMALLNGNRIDNTLKYWVPSYVVDWVDATSGGSLRLRNCDGSDTVCK